MRHNALFVSLSIALIVAIASLYSPYWYSLFDLVNAAANVCLYSRYVV